MEMLSFDLRGKFAHFRKYYTNNTALSFSIPPRTTLMGMTAAILGLSRDSYYEELGPDNLLFGVRALTPLKKSFHRLNLMMIKGSTDFRGQKGRVQTPFEMITGYDLTRDTVAYRIYIMPTPQGMEVYQRLSQTLSDGKLSYSLKLGPAFCLASLENIRIGLQPVPMQSDGAFVEVLTAALVDQVKMIDVSKGKLLIEEELLPATFIGDNNRELASMQRVVFPIDGNPMNVKLVGTYYSIGGDQPEVITLIDTPLS